jgi:hypothetical protein
MRLPLSTVVPGKTERSKGVWRSILRGHIYRFAIHVVGRRPRQCWNGCVSCQARLRTWTVAAFASFGTAIRLIVATMSWRQQTSWLSCFTPSPQISWIAAVAGSQHTLPVRHRSAKDGFLGGFMDTFSPLDLVSIFSGHFSGLGQVPPFSQRSPPEMPQSLNSKFGKQRFRRVAGFDASRENPGLSFADSLSDSPHSTHFRDGTSPLPFVTFLLAEHYSRKVSGSVQDSRHTPYCGRRAVGVPAMPTRGQSGNSSRGERGRADLG